MGRGAGVDEVRQVGDCLVRGRRAHAAHVDLHAVVATRRRGRVPREATRRRVVAGDLPRTAWRAHPEPVLGRAAAGCGAGQHDRRARRLRRRPIGREPARAAGLEDVRDLLHRVVGGGRAHVANVDLEPVRAGGIARGAPCVGRAGAVVLDHAPPAPGRQQPEPVARIGATAGRGRHRHGRTERLR